MLIYFHIPKTAGTSFRGWVKTSLKEKTVYWHGEDGLVPQEKFERLEKAELIGGHFKRGVKVISKLEQVLGAENIWYLATVREPLSQVASHFSFVAERPNNPLYTPLSIDEALQGSTRFYDVQKNLQCSYLSPSRTYIDALNWIKQRNCIIGDFKNLDIFYKEIEKVHSLPHLDLVHSNKSKKEYSQSQESSILKSYVEQFCGEDQKLYNFVSSNGVFVNKI